jgi:UDP-N-acetylmuramate dehydrogenase
MTLLSQLTTLRLGGPARSLIDCHDERSLVAAVRQADAQRQPLLVLGGGSNLVVADEGFPGTVARVLSFGVEQDVDGQQVILHVQAGDEWDGFVARCVGEGLAGLECLSGIPGSVGATPIQNVGAYGQEVRDTVVCVRVYDRVRREIYELAAEECGFSYRSSLFKRTPGRWVVLSVTFSLQRQKASLPIRYPELARALGIELGEGAPLATVRAAVLRLRRNKGMVLDPQDPDSVSAGSFFLNPLLEPHELQRLEHQVQERLGPDVRPPVFPAPDGCVKVPAAWLIERAGFGPGYGDPDGIAISSKHTLALTNRGHGTTAQLVALAAEIVAAVRHDFGIQLVPEPVLVGTLWPESEGIVASALGAGRSSQGLD